jgi:Flp pilus assembly protein TadG
MSRMRRRGLRKVDSLFIDCQAASAVEFALLLPLFLVVLFGIISFGVYLGMAHDVRQLAAEAARSSVAGLTDSERTSLAASYVTQNVAYYALLTPNRVTVNAAASPADANVFVVTVSYDASNSFIYMLPQFFPTPSPNIAMSAAIPRGGY